jgi:hypothetical protein
MAHEELIQAALDWCNKQRELQGKELLNELPKGIQGDSRSCPCGAATGLSVGTYSYSPLPNDGDYNEDYSLPPEVTQFVIAFDKGDIPELIDESESILNP